MTTIRTWLDFALLQTAAESYLDGISLDPQDQLAEPLTRGLIGSRLLNGNKHHDANRNPPGTGITRYTNQQATWFLGTDAATGIEIVDHVTNTASGFSATVFRNRATDEYTISFRSTEYLFGEFDGPDPDQGGDWGRDGTPGADGELNRVGFAFGQLADMERYFANLSAGQTFDGTTETRLAGRNPGGIRDTHRPSREDPGPAGGWLPVEEGIDAPAAAMLR